jgi:signal transduction histidine kinase
VLGWLVAGRVLRPLRTMNTAIKRISARNVHERLGPGPRDELRNLADTVDALLERLDSAFDAQKRFVANAAHELRTPLTLEHACWRRASCIEIPDTSSMRSIMGRLLDLSEQQGRLLESLLTLAKSERRS